MNTEKWLKQNTQSLKGKLIAVTGTTGGIGKELCRYLANLGANLILLDRNTKRSNAFAEELRSTYSVTVCNYTLDLENFELVKNVTEHLKLMPIDLILHNAGAYSIPRKKCTTGFDNVFQINFVSPYYMIRELLPTLKSRHGRVVVVGSIAHNYSKSDPEDIDFSTRKASSKVYGNAKRYLMFSLFELFKNETDATLSITHPGITFTNITAHYPKLIFAVIKHPMKIIFMKPKTAALSILKGVFEPTPYHRWTGPKLFDIWGLPKQKNLKTCAEAESRYIGQTADKIYTLLTENN
ncbi:MAG: SDR family NAD(P)-dependent oxidoreductase [Clostridia bacterium]|nr:SDR family NAD(P)-dependent oxidoreductase [Clostridia bacterium]